MTTPMDPARKDAMRAAADAHVEAATEAGRQMLNLWRSQLDLAMAADDDEAIRGVVGRGVPQLWDNNTNCGSGCGGTGTSLWA